MLLYLQVYPALKDNSQHSSNITIIQLHIDKNQHKQDRIETAAVGACIAQTNITEIENHQSYIVLRLEQVRLRLEGFGIGQSHFALDQQLLHLRFHVFVELVVRAGARLVGQRPQEGVVLVHRAERPTAATSAECTTSSGTTATTRRVVGTFVQDVVLASTRGERFVQRVVRRAARFAGPGVHIVT